MGSRNNLFICICSIIVDMKITSINSLHEALSSGAPVNKVFINERRRDSRIRKIIDLCKERGIPFMLVPQNALNRKAGNENQGVFAEVSPVPFLTLDDITREGKDGLILILDSVTDAGNLGAIIRTAVAAGADGIILARRNTAPLNETVLKASAGAMMNAKIVPSKNIAREIRTLKERGYWIISTNVEAGIPYHEYSFDAPTALVIGSEGRGISTIVKKHTDQFITIPHSKKVDSLNVSAATAVVLFEAVRQRSVKTTAE